MNLKFTSIFLILLIIGSEIQLTQQLQTQYRVDKKTAKLIENVMPKFGSLQFTPDLIKIIKQMVPIDPKFYDDPLVGAKSCFQENGQYKTDNFGNPMKIEIPQDHEQVYVEYFEEQFEQGAFQDITDLPDGLREHIILVDTKYENVKNFAKANLSGLMYNPWKGCVELAQERYKGYGVGFITIFLLSYFKGADPVTAASGAARITAKSFGYKFIQNTLENVLHQMQIISDAEVRQAAFNKNVLESASYLTQVFWKPFVTVSPFQNLIDVETVKITTSMTQLTKYDQYLAVISFIPYAALTQYAFGQVMSTVQGYQSGKQLLMNSSQLVSDIGLNMVVGSYVSTLVNGEYASLLAGIASSVTISLTVSKFYEAAFESDSQLFQRVISEQLSQNFKEFEQVIYESDQALSYFFQAVDMVVKEDSQKLWREFIFARRKIQRRDEICQQIIKEAIEILREHVKDSFESGMEAFKQILENQVEENEDIKQDNEQVKTEL